MTLTATATVLTCPRCQEPMRVYERDGVQIDQCVECRGIFLDRGELDRIIDAEILRIKDISNNGYGRSAVPRYQPRPERRNGRTLRRRGFLSGASD